MNNSKITVLILLIFISIISCGKKENNVTNQQKTIDLDSVSISGNIFKSGEEQKIDMGREQPDWAKNAVIYEVNVRQFSEKGSLAKVTEQLTRIKELGADIIWLMPIYPIGKKGRKGKLGSYYAVKDYKAINPRFGTKEDFKVLVDSAHTLGMKVMLDWVANHTSPDHVWVKKHLDFYVLDSLGKKPIKPKGTDWEDVVKLNYENKAMQDSMISAMSYWLKEFDIDGYRCDVAELVPLEFWEKARTKLDSIKPVFMLAEGTKPELYKAFNMTYGTAFNDSIINIAEGKKGFKSIQNYILEKEKKYKPNDIIMYYITNHDENSWNYTEKEKFAENTDNFTVLTYAMGGIPLIYNGQESGLDKKLKFFEKDTINWGNYKKQDFYKRLNHLLKSHKVLWNNGGRANMEVIKADKNTFQFIISKNKEMIVFLQNYSDKPIYISKLSLNGFNTNLDLLKNEPIPDDNRGIELLPHQTIIIGQ